MACQAFAMVGVFPAGGVITNCAQSSAVTLPPCSPRGLSLRALPPCSQLRSSTSSARLRRPALALSSPSRRQSSLSVTVCAAAAAVAAPVADSQPKIGLLDRIKLAVVNTYLNLFGRFEFGIKLLVALVFPSKIKQIFKGLFQSYKEQVTISLGDSVKASTKTSLIFREMIRAYAGQLLGTPYEFPPYHQAIRTPIDYYQMGNDYVGTLVDFDRSVLGNLHLWDQIQAQVDAGENVILLANHQSEADAAFIPLLTQASHPRLGEKVVYLAGDRVVKDIMSKPFSMGRNLLCIYSKKHMVDDSKTVKSEKMRANLRTLKAMEGLLKKGGCVLWIAPSGGRDRKDESGLLMPDKFDPDAIHMMVKFGTKKTVKKTHFYPMAMATYDIMPPPTNIGGGLGEVRVVNYTGSGISVSDEVDVTENGAWAEGLPEGEHKTALSNYIFEEVIKQYKSIMGCVGTGDDFETPEECSRPWLGM